MKSPDIPGRLKDAFADGAIEAVVDVPAGVLGALRPSTSYPFRRSPITVVAVNAEYAEFETDRGTQRFSAWRLRITDVIGDCLVLDPEIQGW